MHARTAPDFEALYTAMAPRVLALAFQLTGDSALAQDVLQDTFLAVHRGLARFRGEADASTWVYRIAINAAHRARAQRARAGRLERAIPAGDGVASAEPAGGDRLAALYRALDDLSAEHREVISLLALRDLSPAVIADILGVPVGTVHSRSHHARARLREALGGAREA
jgi:RNA polymerase sigma-70 factor (ECF subfamily)